MSRPLYEPNPRGMTTCPYLVPCFSRIHQAVLEPYLASLGYRLLAPRPVEDMTYDICLSLTNNDICYSTAYLLGQLMEALKAEPSLVEGTDIILPLVCLDCRSDEAPRLLAKILGSQGRDCRAVSLREHLESRPLGGQPWTEQDSMCLAQLLCLADVIIQARLRVRSYVDPEHLEALTKDCVRAVHACSMQRRQRGSSQAGIVGDKGQSLHGTGYYSALIQILEAFARVKLRACPQPARIGIVGTYPLLYGETINNRLFSQIADEGCEVSIPLATELFEHFLEQAGGMAPMMLRALKQAREDLLRFVSNEYPALASPRAAVRRDLESFCPEPVPRHLVCGIGWRLPAFTIRMIASGIRDILYIRSFACLSGHTVGQGG